MDPELIESGPGINHFGYKKNTVMDSKITEKTQTQTFECDVSERLHLHFISDPGVWYGSTHIQNPEC
jgi:hypothetical protein